MKKTDIKNFVQILKDTYPDATCSLDFKTPFQMVVAVMLSAQCITKTISGCKKERGRLVFKDRFQKDFTVKNNCDYCYNVIYNTSPLMLLDQKQEIQELNPKTLRLHFTIEEADQVQRILDLYETVFIKGAKSIEVNEDFTRGHFKRGIK